MNINILDSSGNAITPYMATYGIGVSRLVAAAIEAGHDEKGIIWSRAITPFKAIIVNLDYSDENANNVCETIYSNLDCKDDILFDDTAKSSGEKFAVADLLGIPLQIIVGKRNLINKNCEIKIRSSNQRIILPIDNIYKFVDDFYNQKAGSVYI